MWVALDPVTKLLLAIEVGERTLALALEILSTPATLFIVTGWNTSESSSSIRLLSVEPLSGPIFRLPLQGIDWVIVGESPAPGRVVWIHGGLEKLEIGASLMVCRFFFKQWGGTRKKLTGRELDGRTWMKCPSRIRKALSGL